MNNHPPITRDWFRRLYTEILQVTSPPSGEQIPASCLLSGPMFAELRRLADGVEEIDGKATELPFSNLVTELRRGVYHGQSPRPLMERAARELERLTAIVRGLMGPTKRAGYDCLHCHAQIVFGDSVCPVTKELHPAPTPDETTEYAALIAGDQLAHQSLYTPFHERWWQARGGHDKCTVCKPEEPTPSRSIQRRIAAIHGEPAPEFGAQPEHEPVIPEKLISPALLHALKQVWKGEASAVNLDQLITLSKLKLVVATGDERQYVVTDAGRETVGIVPK